MKSLLLTLALVTPLAAQSPTTWRFDNLTTISNNPVTLVGSPKVISTPLGKAIHFEANGTTGDALELPTVPLAGASAYTFELIFRPSSTGHTEQRIFHLQESASQSRRMFEIRIHDTPEGKRWCLDTVAFSYPAGQAARSGVILHCDAEHLFPLDRWYAVAATYDGTTLRGYVDGVLQGEVAVALLPLGLGGASIGTRIDRRDFFTGDILSARFTRRALPAADPLKPPGPQ